MDPNHGTNDLIPIQLDPEQGILTAHAVDLNSLLLRPHFADLVLLGTELI